MTLAYLAFTDRGEALARRLAAELGGEVSRSGRPLTAKQWAEKNFKAVQGLVFVGAAGIAVRSIAPLVSSKAEDPAVVCADDCGHFAVPLLSGHLGGANELAERIASVCGAQAAVTTATDANGVFAFDDWARRMRCSVLDTKGIRAVSSRLLRGETVRFYSVFPVEGALPRGTELTDRLSEADAALLYRKPEDGGALPPLVLIPRCVTVGFGCRRNAPAEALEKTVRSVLDGTGVFPQALCAAATIDLKKDEPAAAALCRRHRQPLYLFTAEELMRAEGDFSSSAFVLKTTGADNVCERAAVCAGGGRLLCRKTAGEGTTAALSVTVPRLRWPDLE